MDSSGKEGGDRRGGQSETAAAILVAAMPQSQLPPLPGPGRSPYGLGRMVGKTAPGSPHPSSDSLPGGSTHFFRQETEAHREEEVGEEDAGEAGRWHTYEVRGAGRALAWRPLDPPPPRPPRGGVRKLHRHAAFGERRWGLRLRGPKAGGGAGLSRSRANHCAPSRIQAQHPRT